jgi:hypothetical protein
MRYSLASISLCERRDVGIFHPNRLILREVLGDGPATYLKYVSFKWRNALPCQLRQSHPTSTGFVAASCSVDAHVRARHRFSSTHKKAPPVRVRLFYTNGKLGDDLLSHGETPHYHRR